MRLIVGAGKINRVIEDAEKKLIKYRDDDGIFYLNHQANTPHDRVVPEDMAITVHVNSVWNLAALKKCLRRIADNGPSIDLGCLPEKPLEQTSPEERVLLAELIEKMANWNDFGTATAKNGTSLRRNISFPNDLRLHCDS
jgi:hypothetical protein